MTDPFGGLEPAPGRALVVESRYTRRYNVWEITNTHNRYYIQCRCPFNGMTRNIEYYPDRHWIAPDVASAVAILKIHGKEVV